MANPLFEIKMTFKSYKAQVFDAVASTLGLASERRAKMVLEIAKRNISPGVGPGPHPHNPGWLHEDTGTGAASLAIKTVGKAQHWVGSFPETSGSVRGTPAWFYLTRLEFGYTSRGGRTIRYPWLSTAINEARMKKVGTVQGPNGIYITGL